MEGSRPTAEEVITKLKDDGDFDTLRLKIIRKIKENEELRSSIVTEVKQSAVLNLDGSENLKPRQLSDAIYQELGKKIMGQISDEVWKVIRSNGNIKDEIRETVESVYDRIMNPNGKKEDYLSSPPQQNPSNPTEDSVSPVKTSTSEPNEPPGIAPCDESEPNGPPGFAPSDQQQAGNGKLKPLPSQEEVHRSPEMVRPSDAMPPGFGPFGGGSDDDPDVPPGFG